MNNARGFTLIEMLVALAIFSMAALALLRLDSLSVRTTVELSDRAMARLVAENEAALVASAPSAPGEGQETSTVENGGRQFLVMRDVRPLPDPNMVAVTIAARPLEGGSMQQLTLVRPVGRR